MTVSFSRFFYAAGNDKSAGGTSKKRLILVQYESKRLKAKGLSGKVRWKSSNKKVARVSSSGMVQAIGAGKCTITARTKGGICKYRLKVNELKLMNPKVTIVRKRQVQLLMNNRQLDVKWNSSDSKVASVDARGVVTGNSKGTCIVYGQYKDDVFLSNVTVTTINWDNLQKTYPPDESNFGKILLAGSSSIDGWYTAGQAFSPYQIINMGYSGSTVTQWIAHYKAMILPYKPAAVVVYVGMNDIVLQHVDGISNAKNTKKLLALLHKRLKNVPVYYISICPAWAYPGDWTDITVSNQAIQKYCSKTENVYYINLADSLNTQSGTPDKKLFSSDQMHPNLRGYEVWRTVVAGTVKKDLKKE